MGDEQGGKGLGNNQAGAKYGTGYCDAQCPHDIKFIDGEANTIDWTPNPKDEDNNMGLGKYGTCCAEMDIWEANSMATAYTPHPCSMDAEPGQLRCEGIQCGDTDKGERYQGVCDKDGCDINPFRMGNESFYGKGPGFAVDTTKPMTQVTQFLTTDGTDDGDLLEIRRFYVQDGRIIHSPPSTILGPKNSDSITDEFCAAKKDLFEDVNHFQQLGGNRQMGRSLDRGQVLALSLWDDVEVNMLWLDSAFPLDKPTTSPGIRRGTCPGGESSTPTYVRNTYPDGYVLFANAAIGEIGSTLLGSTGPFLLHHHRLALNNVRQNQAKIHLNAVVRPRSDASRWLSTKTSANGQNVLVQARQQCRQQPLHLQPQPHLWRHQHPPNQCASWIET